MDWLLGVMVFRTFSMQSFCMQDGLNWKDEMIRGRLNERRDKMYCYVIFGENDDNHTRKYLYKCGEIIPGDTVVVPAKKTQKIALVHSLLEAFPEELGLRDSSIENVIAINKETIEAQDVSSYILALIDE